MTKKTDVTEHSFTAVESEDGATHYLVCECGCKIENLPHEYTAIYISETMHKHVCECGKESEELETTWSYGITEDDHWLVCACGCKTDSEEHSYTPTGDETSHWDGCVCGKKINENAHEYTAIFAADGHRHVCECGKEVTLEGSEIVIANDADYHWTECVHGYKASEPAAHTFENKNDEKAHWLECECGREAEKEDHEAYLYTNSDLTHHWSECEKCGYEGTRVSHSYTTDYNLVQHWLVCECGHKCEETNHQLVYEYDDEMEEYICTVNFDEDEMAMLHASRRACPYYRFYDEYKMVQKQN